MLVKLCSAINVKVGGGFVGKIMLGDQRKGGGRFLLVKLCLAINVKVGGRFLLVKLCSAINVKVG